MTLYQEKNSFKTRQTVFRLVSSGYLSVKQAAEILNCRRETIWYRRKKIEKYGTNAVVSLKRGPKPFDRAWNRTSKELEDLVASIRDLYQTGPDDIKYILSEQDIHLTRITVYRILLRTKRIIPKDKSTRIFKRYTLGFPGAEIQIDPTYIEEAKRPYWIFAGIDDHTRWSFTEIVKRKTSKAAIRFLYQIILKAPFPIQAVRTDRGCEFGPEFTKACGKLNIVHIKNRIKTPIHNGKVERFHRTLQWEWLYRYGVDIESTLLQYKLNQYLSFYNYQRHHQGMGMEGRTPFQQLTKFIKDNQFMSSVNVRRTMIRYTS